MAAAALSGVEAHRLFSPVYTPVSLPINHNRKVKQGVLNQEFLSSLYWINEAGPTHLRDWAAFDRKMEDTMDLDTREFE